MSSPVAVLGGESERILDSESNRSNGEVCGGKSENSEDDVESVRIRLLISDRIKPIPIDVPADATASGLHALSAEATGIVPVTLILCYGGHIIHSEGRRDGGGGEGGSVFAEHKIKENCVIHCYVRRPLAFGSGSSKSSTAIVTRNVNGVARRCSSGGGEDDNDGNASGAHPADKALVVAVHGQDWDLARNLLRLHPDISRRLVQYQDGSRQTALHRLAQFLSDRRRLVQYQDGSRKSPLYCLSQFLSDSGEGGAVRRSGRPPPRKIARGEGGAVGGSGRPPRCYASSASRSSAALDDVFKELIALHSEACLLPRFHPHQGEGGFPLLLAFSDERIDWVLRFHPEIARLKESKDGKTLLHLGLAHVRNSKCRHAWDVAMPRLLEIAPEVLHASDNQGSTPLDIFFDSSNWLHEEALFPRGLLSTAETLLRACYCRERRAVAADEDNAAVDDSTAHEDSKPWQWFLHAAMTVRECPWSLIPSFLLRYSHQARVTGLGGNLPLHLACGASHKRTMPYRDCTDDIRNSKNCRARALKEIIGAHPEAASTRNCRGNLPLHEAFAGETIPWFDEVALGEVFRAHPEAVAVRNGEGCTPLHLAMLHETSIGNEGGQEQLVSSSEASQLRDVDSPEFLANLSAIFWLLKKDPGAVQF